MNRYAIVIVLALLGGCDADIEMRALCFNVGYIGGLVSGKAGIERLRATSAVERACLAQHVGGR